METQQDSATMFVEIGDRHVNWTHVRDFAIAADPQTGQRKIQITYLDGNTLVAPLSDDECARLTERVTPGVVIPAPFGYRLAHYSGASDLKGSSLSFEPVLAFRVAPDRPIIAITLAGEFDQSDVALVAPNGAVTWRRERVFEDIESFKRHKDVESFRQFRNEPSAVKRSSV